MPSNKFLAILFVIGISVLSLILYALFISGDEKIEASKVSGGAQGGEFVIFIQDRGYKPDSATIKVGTQVKWVNQASKPHGVAFRLGSTLENLTQLDQELKTGESVSFKFERMGVFHYYDKNSSSSGTLEVK